jgi:hypothetical protein
MLFSHALMMLLFYDLCSKFCRFQTLYSMVKSWKVTGQANENTIDRVCTGRELRVRFLSQAGALSAAFLHHYVLIEKEWGASGDGAGRPEASVQSPCMGRG